MSEGHALVQWIANLNRQKVPAFAETTKKLARLTQNKVASAADLAKVILQDTPLASKVLKLVNCSIYNPTSKRVDTVSQAIVVLGVDRVRNLAITVSFLEDLLSTNNLLQVHKQTVIAFHAAVISRRLAELIKVENSEQLYLNALFKRLGHILYWCFPHQEKEQLLKAFPNDIPPEGEEKHHIGFDFVTLTEQLIKHWHLNPVTEADNTQADSLILLAYAIANGLPQGWQHPGIQFALKRIHSICRLTEDELKIWLMECVKQANNGLKTLNVAETLLPNLATPPLNTQNELSQESSSSENITESIESEKRMGSLRLLMHLLNYPIDLDYLQLTLLEGIVSELKCPTAFILGRKRKSQKFVLRHNVGEKSNNIANKLIQFMEKSSLTQLETLMSNHFPFYCTIKSPQALHTENRILGPHYLCYPIMANDLCMGYLFALSAADIAINEDLFDQFCHYCEHANLAFKLHSLNQTETSHHTQKSF